MSPLVEWLESEPDALDALITDGLYQTVRKNLFEMRTFVDKNGKRIELVLDTHDANMVQPTLTWFDGGNIWWWV